MKKIFLILVTSLVLFSCNKEEDLGDKAVLIGEWKINSNTNNTCSDKTSVSFTEDVYKKKNFSGYDSSSGSIWSDSGEVTESKCESTIIGCNYVVEGNKIIYTHPNTKKEVIETFSIDGDKLTIKSGGSTITYIKQ